MRGVRFLGALLMAAVVACAHAAPLSAQSWKVEHLGHEVWATRPDLKGLRVRLYPSGGGTPSVASWEPAPTAPGIFMLKYVAGEIGTSEQVLELRVAVVRLKDRRVLLDEVYAYKKAAAPLENSGPQPSWTWTSKSLLVETPDRASPRQIDL